MTTPSPPTSSSTRGKRKLKPLPKYSTYIKRQNPGATVPPTSTSTDAVESSFLNSGSSSSTKKPKTLTRRNRYRKASGGWVTSTDSTSSSGGSKNSLENGSSPDAPSQVIRFHQKLGLGLDNDQYGTAWVQGLRIAVLLLLVLTMVFLSSGMYYYTRIEEKHSFESEFEVNAMRIVERFHDSVEYNIGVMNSMSTTITSYAQNTNQSFPCVTLPDFALRGSDFRIQSQTVVLHWMPLVNDTTREKWETYALQNRFQINDAYEEDLAYREQQDAAFERANTRTLQQQPDEESQAQEDSVPLPFSVLSDGSGYHTKIWSTGIISPKGDKPIGSGPFLPLWQRSPINMAKQALLNMDFGDTKALEGVLPIMEENPKAMLNQAIIPEPDKAQQFEANLRAGQYRNSAESYKTDPLTFLAYPVFDSFGENRQLVGVIATSLYWRLVFSQLLPAKTTGIICVLENSFNQSLSYRVDGNVATYLGPGDLHDTKYDHLEVFENVNDRLHDLASVVRQSYRAVPICTNYGRYTVRVYPTSETVSDYMTNEPIIYSVLVACAFLFTSMVFLMYTYLVERRQKMVMDIAMKNASRAVETERELNEFLSHEVRNPLAAAMSACSFVSTNLHDISPGDIVEKETTDILKEDVHVINSSLTFINDFLRSMLDLNRATDKKIELHEEPADLAICVIQPVLAMIYTRNVPFEVQMECPENLTIMTDILRLKQVLLNLARNSAKFVDKGFIRIKAEVIDGRVLIYVQDSGPGIPPEKRDGLFNKFQESLDIMCQGTGIGLSLVKSLVDTMGGQIWLDKDYDSGIEGCPGVGFVIQTNREPIEDLVQRERDFLDSVEGGTSLGNVSTNLPSHDTSSMREAEAAELPEEFSVLFVDDDNMLRKLFVRAVKKMAPTWKVTEAVNGETALQLAQKEHIDLICLDMYMSSVVRQLTGCETARELRAQGYNNRICGLSANDLEASFIESGADCFMMKPFPCKSDELKAALLMLVALRQEETV